jgi:hypothetical protein
MFSTHQVKIPWPEFIVLYNGSEPQPDEQTLKLSDAFEIPDLPGFDSAKPPMELVVKMYNINNGLKQKRMKASRTLEEYSIFIAKVRECEAQTANGRRISDMTEHEHKEALRMAVDWGIANNILKAFLEKHRTEVIDMLYDESDWDTELRVRYEDGKFDEKADVARNALTEGLPLPTIQRLTGLDTATIQSLAARPAAVI